MKTIPSILNLLALGLTLTTVQAQASPLIVDSIQRSYSGVAETSSSTQSYPVYLNAQVTGAGSMAEQSVNSSHGGGNAVAYGLAAAASVADLGNAQYQLQFDTSSKATHQAQAQVVYTPSYGSSTASVAFSAHLNIGGAAPSNLLYFTAATVISGNGNTGTLQIQSDLDGLLFSSDISSLASAWSVSASGGSTVTINVNLSSHSFRDVGTNLYTIYSDSDAQSLTLGIDTGMLPIPSTLLLMSFGLLGLPGVCGRRGRYPTQR